MKKLLKVLLVFSALPSFFLSPKLSRAQSVPDVVITCDQGGCDDVPGPLFSEDDMYPGLEVTKSIEAVNNYGQERDFAVEALKLTSTGNLDQVLTIEIKESESGNVVYTKNVLANFIGQHHVLSSVSNLTEESKIYQVTVGLPTWVGNDYQDKNLSFDLNLGFEMMEVEETPTPTLTPTTTPTTTSGPSGPTNTPVPSDNGCTADMPSDINDLTAVGGINTATLSWSPSSPVTHYEIRYGLSTGDYLYGSGNIGNVTSYVVSGLSAGFTYYFQVVPINDCQAGNWSNEATAEISSGTVLVEEGETPPPATGFGEVEGEQTEPGQVSGEGQAPPSEEGQTAGVETEKRCFWWLLNILALIINSLFVYKKREDLEENKKLWFVPLVLSLVAFFGDKIAHNWFVPSRYCQWTWLLALVSFFLPFSVYYRKK